MSPPLADTVNASPSRTKPSLEALPAAPTAPTSPCTQPSPITPPDGPAIANTPESALMSLASDWLLTMICAPGVGGFGLFQVHERALAGRLLHSEIGEKPVPSVVNASAQCVTLLKSPDAVQRTVYGVPAGTVAPCAGAVTVTLPG